MAVCELRTLFLIACALDLIVTLQRQVFDFLGYMWLPIISNFINIIFIIFGCFGAIQNFTKYLFAFAIWSFTWLTWNVFLICYFLNLGSLNNESGLLSLGTGSVSWWESNGWGCVPVWTEAEGASSWRPARVDGCLLPWPQVELSQSILGAVVSCMILPLAVVVTCKATKRRKSLEKESVSRRSIYKVGLSSTEPIISDNTLKPMTPRRVKRRSGSRGTGSSVRRSRRSYRNAAYLTSSTSLPRDSRISRPTSAHSSYSNFHAARPASYHAPEPSVRPNDSYDPPPAESTPAMATAYNTGLHGHDAVGFDVAGPYNEPSRRYEHQRHNDVNMHSYDRRSNYEGTISCYMRAETMETPCESPTYRGAEAGWEAPLPPPPAPPYSSRATPQAPGPPAYQPATESYNIT